MESRLRPLRYGIYGLTIESDTELPGAESLIQNFEAPADCELHTGSELATEGFDNVCTFDADDPVTISRNRRDPSTYLLEYRDGNRFLIGNRGARIHAVWPASSSAEDMTTYLIGPVLAFILRLRGTLSLHGSAVIIGSGAVALVGPSGAGKSTTASAFAERGAGVLSDDVVAISWRDGKPWVESGYPRIRLWPSLVQARYGGADVLPLLTPNWEKRYLDVAATGVFVAEAHPLRAIVLLGSRVSGPADVEQLVGPDAAIELIANTSMAMYLGPELREQELATIADLAEQVPLFRARPRDDLQDLDEFCNLVRDHLAKV